MTSRAPFFFVTLSSRFAASGLQSCRSRLGFANIIGHWRDTAEEIPKLKSDCDRATEIAKGKKCNAHAETKTDLPWLPGPKPGSERGALCVRLAPTPVKLLTHFAIFGKINSRTKVLIPGRGRSSLKRNVTL